MSENTSFYITDPVNVVLDNSSVSGSLGNMIKSYTGSYLLDFSPSDFSTSEYTTNATNLFNGCTKLAGMCKLPSSITDAYSMFGGCIGLASIDTTTFINVTTTSNMFNGCNMLASVDTTAFANVTNASEMFSGCTVLASIDTAAFTNATNASSMFYRCAGLTSIDTSAFTKVTNASGMFNGCEKLTSIDTAAFTNVTIAGGMFSNCTGLTTIDTTAFTKVTNTNSMFDGCTKLTSIDTSAFTNVTDTRYMFHGCTGLTTITGASAFTNVTNTNSMFEGCAALAKIKNFSIPSKCSSYQDMLTGCTALSEIAFSDDLLYSTWYSRIVLQKGCGLSSAQLTSAAKYSVSPVLAFSKIAINRENDYSLISSSRSLLNIFLSSNVKKPYFLDKIEQRFSSTDTATYSAATDTIDVSKVYFSDNAGTTQVTPEFSRVDSIFYSPKVDSISDEKTYFTSNTGADIKASITWVAASTYASDSIYWKKTTVTNGSISHVIYAVDSTINASTTDWTDIYTTTTSFPVYEKSGTIASSTSGVEYFTKSGSVYSLAIASTSVSTKFDVSTVYYTCENKPLYIASYTTTSYMELIPYFNGSTVPNGDASLTGLTCKVGAVKAGFYDKVSIASETSEKDITMFSKNFPVKKFEFGYINNGGMIYLYDKKNASVVGNYHGAYIIVYHENDDTGNTYTQNATYNETSEKVTRLKAFMFSDYTKKTFLSWTTNKDGSGTSYKDNVSVGNLSSTGGIVDLYAKYLNVDWNKALYTKHVVTSWANLSTAISGMTENTSFCITDTANVVLDSSSTSGSLGNTIKSYTGSYLLDFGPCDFSTTKYTSNATNLFYGCTKLAGMCKLPSSITDASYMFYECTGLISIDTSAFTKVTNASSMFVRCAKLTSIDTAAFTNVTNANSMFSGCRLTSINTAAFTNVTNASFMFWGCTGLTSIDTAAFTNVTSATSMFSYCTGLTSINTAAFTKVTNTSAMFQGCAKLTLIDTAAFTKVIDAASMFGNCTGLTSIDTSAFTNVTIAGYMFQGCAKLTLIDTTPFTNVTNALEMFWGCTGLTSIDTAAFTKVTDARYMFDECTGLTSIDTSAFTNVTIADQMFQGCSKLASIDKFGMLSSKCTSYSTMFSGCTSLKSIVFMSASEYTAWYSKLITTNNTNLTTAQITAAKTYSGSPRIWFVDKFSNALYTKHVETTWANLSTAVSGMTENTSFYITDPANVVLDSSSTSGSLGNIIKSYTGSYLLDFSPSDFSTAKYTANATDLFNGCIKLAGICKLPSSITSASWMLNGCSKLTSIDTSCFTNVIDASYMFSNCTGLTSINTAAFTKVTNTSAMFYRCTGLTSIDTAAFTNVTNASSMFQGCTKLTSIDTTPFTKVTNASCIFMGCTELTSIDTAAFTNVTNTNSMFAGCTGLTSIDATGFTNVTNASYMFNNCTGLTSIDTAAFTNVTNTSYMFSGCTKLTSIDTSCFTNVTDASYMFWGCSELISIVMSTFIIVTDASCMFEGCTKLATINKLRA